MKRNFMKRYLDGTHKKEAAPVESKKTAAQRPEEARPPENAEKPAAEAQGTDGDIFDDTDVCRVLGVRRRVLVRFRTERSRGEAWDANGTHAGMTRRWIEARKKGATEGLKPVERHDGIVTVRFVRRVANEKMAGVKLIASGKERIAWVHDANAMNLGEEFDCRWIGRQLHYVDALNREAY